MPNDRGSIKWTSMMIPEHVELLKKLWVEDNKQPKPILDPQYLEEMEYTLLQAYHTKLPIRLTFYANKREKITKVGIIKNWNIENQSIILQLQNHKNMTIAFSTLLSASLIE